jgi:predicted  nucleic acid-binding Zn-ribbon protein
MKITCSKCGHQWNYSGNLLYATCPSCRLKTKSYFKEIKDKQSKSSKRLMEGFYE